MNKFNLKINNSKLAKYIKESDEDCFSILTMAPVPFKKITGVSFKQVNNLNYPSTLDIIKFFVKNKYINSEWIEFAHWYERRKKQIKRMRQIYKLNWFESRPFFYKGIKPELISILLKKGSTTAEFTEDYEDKFFEKEKLPRSEYIWGDENVSKAWEYAENHNPSIIIVYRKKYFKHRNIENNRHGVWQKRNPHLNYLESIEAIISIHV